MTRNELRRAQSPRLFLNSLLRLVPSATLEDLRPDLSTCARRQCGPTDLSIGPSISWEGGVPHVWNAPSPRATASLAVTEEITRVAMLHGTARHGAASGATEP